MRWGYWCNWRRLSLGWKTYQRDSKNLRHGCNNNWIHSHTEGMDWPAQQHQNVWKILTDNFISTRSLVIHRIRGRFCIKSIYFFIELIPIWNTKCEKPETGNMQRQNHSWGQHFLIAKNVSNFYVVKAKVGH